MTRRVLLLAACPLVLRADSAQEVWQALADAATALGQDSTAAFLAGFDKAMPGYESLRDEVVALIRTAEVQSSIEPVSNEGNDEVRTLQVNWLLSLRWRDDTGRSTRRQETVTCRFRKQGRKWRIVELSPLPFFAPPRP